MTVLTTRLQSSRRTAIVTVIGASLGFAALATPAAAIGQEAFPSRAITLIVPFPPGGATDAHFRAIGRAASSLLKQPIVILNQPGAAGTMGPAKMARSAAPDGYIISAIVSSLYRLPHLQTVNYEIDKDFTFISGIAEYVFCVAVGSESPYKTAQDLVAAAKARPGQINVGAISIGSPGHVALLRWGKLAGFRPNYIPFKGASDEIMAVLGGHVDAITEAGLSPMIQQGKLRPLAIYSEQRNALFPGVPTLKELGWDVTVRTVTGIVGPKGMDPKVVQALQGAFRKSMDDPDFKKVLEVNGLMPAYMNSAEYTRFVADQSEFEKHSIQELKAAGVNFAQ